MLDVVGGAHDALSINGKQAYELLWMRAHIDLKKNLVGKPNQPTFLNILYMTSHQSLIWRYTLVNEKEPLKCKGST